MDGRDLDGFEGTARFHSEDGKGGKNGMLRDAINERFTALPRKVRGFENELVFNEQSGAAVEYLDAQNLRQSVAAAVEDLDGDFFAAALAYLGREEERRGHSVLEQRQERNASDENEKEKNEKEEKKGKFLPNYSQ